MLLRLNSVFKMVMEHMWNIHQCSILILIYTLLLSEGETREPRKTFREQWNIEQELFSVLNGQTHLLVTEVPPRRAIHGQTDMWSCTADGKGSDTKKDMTLTQSCSFSCCDTLILCTYNACAANSHTAADCSPSDLSITNTTFNCPIDTHAKRDVGAPTLSLLASELSRRIDCGCNFYTSKRVGCHMARRDLKWGIKRFLPQLWFL